jgi:hypothetical protein
VEELILKNNICNFLNCKHRYMLMSDKNLSVPLSFVVVNCFSVRPSEEQGRAGLLEIFPEMGTA